MKYLILIICVAAVMADLKEVTTKVSPQINISLIIFKVAFTIAIDGEERGEVVMGLFGNTVPKTAENFRVLCTGEMGKNNRG